MHINDPAAQAMHEQTRALAEGKLKCACGNDVWENFLFVGAQEQVMAGCKRCGRAHLLKDGQWIEKSGPAPGVQG
jgi:hypothetical protein